MHSLSLNLNCNANNRQTENKNEDQARDKSFHSPHTGEIGVKNVGHTSYRDKSFHSPHTGEIGVKNAGHASYPARVICTACTVYGIGYPMYTKHSMKDSRKLTIQIFSKMHQ